MHNNIFMLIFIVFLPFLKFYIMHPALSSLHPLGEKGQLKDLIQARRRPSYETISNQFPFREGGEGPPYNFWLYFSFSAPLFIL